MRSKVTLAGAKFIADRAPEGVEIAPLLDALRKAIGLALVSRDPSHTAPAYVEMHLRRLQEAIEKSR